jgi:hypothetical protein
MSISFPVNKILQGMWSSTRWMSWSLSTFDDKVNLVFWDHHNRHTDNLSYDGSQDESQSGDENAKSEDDEGPEELGVQGLKNEVHLCSIHKSTATLTCNRVLLGMTATMKLVVNRPKTSRAPPALMTPWSHTALATGPKNHQQQPLPLLTGRWVLVFHLIT